MIILSPSGLHGLDCLVGEFVIMSEIDFGSPVVDECGTIGVDLPVVVEGK
jgi:hypothetical protein